VDPDVAETGQPYAFTGDDPLNSTDPLGLSAPSPDVLAYYRSVRKHKQFCQRHPGIGGHSCGGLWHEVTGTVKKVGHFVAKHKVVEGIVLGAIAVGTGGAGLVLDAGVVAGTLTTASVVAGVGATALDGSACKHGHDAACVGATLGAAGALGSAGGVPAAFSADAVPTLGGAFSSASPGFGAITGIAGLVFDGTKWATDHG
jgi:hypothetical protein